MSNKKKLDENSVKEILKDHVEDSTEINSIIEEAGLDFEKCKSTGKLTKIQIHDIKELFAKCLLENMRRSDCIDLVASFLENKHNIEVGKDISVHAMIKHYEVVRKQIFKRSVDSIESARDKYVADMQRLILKAENANDISTAIKGVKELAEFEGALTKKDDSKIVLNFLPIDDKPKKD